jgi:small subunit ribosomal protein S17
MFRRKKKDEPTDAPQAPETTAEGGDVSTQTAEASSAPQTDAAASSESSASAATGSAPAESADAGAPAGNGIKKSSRGNRVQKVGTVSSDKMQKTVIVRVDRQVLHPKYRRYVRRTSKFMAHDDLGATVGDRVRIVETRPLSAKKRWRVIEIVQKAAK